MTTTPIRILLAMVATLCAAAALVASATTPAPAGAKTANAAVGNPFAGARFYVLRPGDIGADAADQARAWARSRPGNAALLRKIAGQPWAEWYGGWLPDPGTLFRQRVRRRYAPTYTTALIAIHALPDRACSGAYTSGGPRAYRAFVGNLANAIGSYPTIVVVEPDGVPDTPCGGRFEHERLVLIRYATRTLSALPHTGVYIDAGRSDWTGARTIIPRLRQAGVQYARGFALDVTGYDTTAAELRFGDKLGRALGGKHFIINTSRNGNGPLSFRRASSTNELWCNTPGRALGNRPTSHTGNPLADAFAWVLHPGYSDGHCQGGPTVGRWWLSYALALARRAHW
jgi:endoglucanase